jgi:hypothetical protein
LSKKVPVPSLNLVPQSGVEMPHSKCIERHARKRRRRIHLLQAPRSDGTTTPDGCNPPPNDLFLVIHINPVCVAADCRPKANGRVPYSSIISGRGPVQRQKLPARIPTKQCPYESQERNPALHFHWISCLKGSRGPCRHCFYRIVHEEYLLM